MPSCFAVVVSCHSVTRSGGWLSVNMRLTLWLLIAGCPVPALALTQDELDTSRSLWNINGLTDYNYVLQRQCNCIGDARRPGLVQVRGGAITAVSDVETLQPINPSLFRTVDGLFDELQNAIDQSADDIQAEFDSRFNYPTSIWIDFDRGIADEELIYFSRDLHVISIPGDFDGNGVLDIDDLDSLTTAIVTGSIDMRFDVDQSGIIDSQDQIRWVKDLKQTWFGDANLDLEFNSSDMVQVFQSGLYENIEYAGWSDGDWNGDGLFSSADLVTAFQDGGYEQGPREAAVSAVPEPTSLVSTLAGVIGLVMMSNCRRKSV